MWYPKVPRCATPALRRRVAADLAGPTLSRPKVIAAVVQLLERTLIRVGNDEYARANDSFGLTTMKNGHANAQARRNVLAAVDAVAGLLGNSRSVCRKCYIHPAIVDAYMDGELALDGRGSRSPSARALDRTETAVLSLLQRRLRRAQRRTA
jgi:DNA topoisomerase IB